MAEALVCRAEHSFAQTLSRINALLLGSSDYQSPFWITFKQTLDLGGHVRKGKTSTPVIYYKILEKRDEAGNAISARGRKTRAHSFRPVGECFQSRPDRGIEAPSMTVNQGTTQSCEKAAAIVEILAPV